MTKDKKPEQKNENHHIDIKSFSEKLKDFSFQAAFKGLRDKLLDVKNGFSESFKQDTSLKILSLVIAIGIWAVVSISVYPTMESVYYNVPVQISLENTYAEANQLSVMASSTDTVTVKLSGNRSFSTV